MAEFLTQEELADRWRMSARTLERWRSKGNPKHFRKTSWFAHYWNLTVGPEAWPPHIGHQGRWTIPLVNMTRTIFDERNT
jgi:hypothetical protein